MADLPLLYSFRRCPYAMRARMALAASGQVTQLREIILRDKPAHMVEISPKATVPVLMKPDGTIIEQSLDIMLWALECNDPLGWMAPELGDKNEMLVLIEEMDGPFKSHLDNYKYAIRHVDAEEDPTAFAHEHRNSAMRILMDIDQRLSRHPYMFGNRPSLADIAIAPFVRQFANTDRDWFDAQPAPNLHAWLNRFLESDLFQNIMTKFPKWQEGDAPTVFPDF